MPPRTEHLPFSGDLLAEVAQMLLDRLPGAGTGDLTGGLVLLPSSRACRALGHHLLERSGREALVLPTILTDVQWAEQVAAPVSPNELPADVSRSLLLARRLESVDWLEGGPSAAPGLAEAFLAFFDEVRRHGLAERILEGDDAEPIVQLARTADAETVADEVARIREVWGMYRSAVPVDEVDRMVALAADLKKGAAAGQPHELVVVAGFGRIDPLRADLLRAALDQGDEGLLILPEVADPLDQLLVATWGAAENATGPEAGARRLAALVAEVEENDPAEGEGPPLGERLEALRGLRQALADRGPDFVVADNPEDEALLVAGRVAAWLETNGAPERGITVATADPGLASRITARLTDAGLDADNTVGEPLSALPAGLLIRFILRAALTDLRAEPLLEVLGHPYTDLGDKEAATGTWALRLERMFRRETGPQSGLAGLHRRAAERDEAALRIFERQTPGMQVFVGRLAGAFAPLLDLAGEKQRPWATFLMALGSVWENLAPTRPLDGEGESDQRKAAEILDELVGESGRLPEITLSGFAADLGRIMASANVTPHRPQGIPIQVTGLVEARLARSDLLILAGLNDGIFPAPARDKVVLPGRVRKLLGMSTWRESRAADSELFLRLLHGAPEVMLSWSKHRDGQSALPSPLAERLRIGLEPRDDAAFDRRAWRREEPPVASLAAAEKSFGAEPAAVPLYIERRPLKRLSWSALRVWRDCPYRTLLERGLALRAEEDVRDEFGKKEYGSIVHAVLAEAFDAGHPCYAALVEGRVEDAGAILTETARATFLPGSAELPIRRLWLETFLRIVPGLVGAEANRMADWRPVALEVDFELPLKTLAEWAWASARALGLEVPAGIPEGLPDHAVEVVFTGQIDRIDRRADGAALAIVDYKTGTIPSPDRITDFEDLQLPLYALAVTNAGVEGVTGEVAEGLFYGLDEKKLGPALKKGSPPLDGDQALLTECAFELVRLGLGATDPGAIHPLLPRAVAGELKGDLPCKWCDFRGACRIEERRPTPAVTVQLDKIVNAKEGGR